VEIVIQVQHNEFDFPVPIYNPHYVYEASIDKEEYDENAGNKAPVIPQT